MAEKAKPGSAPPETPSAYGEADSEAASMDKAAQKDESRGRTAVADASRAASEAAAKVPPAESGPVGQGTAEVDVKRRIAETARRKSAEAARAKED